MGSETDHDRKPCPIIEKRHHRQEYCQSDDPERGRPTVPSSWTLTRWPSPSKTHSSDSNQHTSYDGKATSSWGGNLMQRSFVREIQQFDRRISMRQPPSTPPREPPHCNKEHEEHHVIDLR